MKRGRGRPRSPLRGKILELLTGRAPMTTREICHEIEIHRANAYHFLVSLEEEGYVVRDAVARAIILWSRTDKELA